MQRQGVTGSNVADQSAAVTHGRHDAFLSHDAAILLWPGRPRQTRSRKHGIARYDGVASASSPCSPSASTTWRRSRAAACNPPPTDRLEETYDVSSLARFARQMVVATAWTKARGDRQNRLRVEGVGGATLALGRSPGMHLETACRAPGAHCHGKISRPTADRAEKRACRSGL